MRGSLVTRLRPRTNRVHTSPITFVFVSSQAFDDAIRGGPDENGLRERNRAHTSGFFLDMSLVEATPTIRLDLESRCVLELGLRVLSVVFSACLGDRLSSKYCPWSLGGSTYAELLQSRD